MTQATFGSQAGAPGYSLLNALRRDTSAAAGTRPLGLSDTTVRSAQRGLALRHAASTIVPLPALESGWDLALLRTIDGLPQWPEVTHPVDISTSV